MPRVAVVTDSSASLPSDVAQREGIVVVPLQVVIGAHSYDEHDREASPQRMAEALEEFVPVSTSRPAPAVFADTYARLVDGGAEAIVSVHLSSEMSGTFEAAQLAGRDAAVPVLAVDTRQVGTATGYAAVTAAEAAAAGESVGDVAAAARARAEAATSLFYVDTLEYLRRGGRIGAAAALLGGALAVKPLLTLREGRVHTLEKVRTAGRALARLEELAVEAAGSDPADVAVAHLAGESRAVTLTNRLTDRLAENLGGAEIWCGEVGAALGAHVGPGMVSVCVAPRF